MSKIANSELPSVSIFFAHFPWFLCRFELQSDTSIALLSDFLFENAEHFIHELVAFATSSFDIEAYDATVQYPPIVSILWF